MTKNPEIEIINEYKIKKDLIKERLELFKQLPQDKYFQEFIFCILTPQSNAKKCWQAVEQLSILKEWDKERVSNIIKTKTRFHNNKTSYLLEASITWNNVKESLNKENKKEIRNFLAENVKGYGLKEAAHFLRNIGKSNNEIAILDRHILRNLKALNVIEDDKIKNKKHYFEIENRFIEFSKRINIPLDSLDLLFWSRENGEIFK
ncbi:MAG: DNA lyase [Nanoarchaeota archaeon]|nr:DNA lyase [Nanoarchaeota archaeon]